MSKKWKIFGLQSDIEWYDVKTKLKQFTRRITYSFLMRELICLILSLYMKLVYVSSKKIFVNYKTIFEALNNKTPLIVTFWHNRLMMIPFATKEPKRLFPGYNFMTLASRHGDGHFVGRVMEKLGLISIYGSSQGGRKSSRGIDLKSFRKIFEGLKNGYSLGLTPDGPRGPNQKINGEIVNIARISGAGILAMSYSSSRFKQLNTWDKFRIPLPFGTLCFYFDDKPIYVSRNASVQEMEKIKILAEERMNFAQEESLRLTK